MTAFQSQVCTPPACLPHTPLSLGSSTSQLLQPRLPLVITSPALPARTRFRRVAPLKAYTAAMLEVIPRTPHKPPGIAARPVNMKDIKVLNKNQGLLSGNFPKLLKEDFVHFLMSLRCHLFQTLEQELNHPAP